MIINYKHPELGEDIQGRAGYYTAMEEHTMAYDGRTVFYVMGMARLERPCCGGACCWGYIQVPGFLAKEEEGALDGRQVSRIEIIEDEEDRSRIRQALIKRHPGVQVEIWGALYAQEAASRQPAALAE